MQKYGLEIGMEYKTNEVYKNIFGKELAKNGDKRKRQTENINCFLKYEKGSKRGYIKIIEFLDKPLPVVEDKRVFNKGGNNIATAIDLETIIIYLVNEHIKRHKGESLFLSKSNALVVCNLIHENYKKANIKTSEVAQELNIDEEYLRKFFIKNHNQITRKLERALNRLNSQRCISFNKCFIIIEHDETTKTIKHRVTTRKESDIILSIEAKALSELGLKNKGEVYIRNMNKSFKRKCENQLREHEDLFTDNKNKYYIGYYEGYEIRATEETMKRAIDVLQYDIASIEVNNKILIQCDKTMKKDQLEIISKLDNQIDSLKNVAFGEPPEEFIDMHERAKETYKGISTFLIKGEMTEEFKNAVSKDAIDIFMD